MSGFVQARANNTAKQRAGLSESHLKGSAGAEQAAPQALSLLQMRQALDRSPRVQSQAALQRALDRSAGAGMAPAKRKEKPALQRKGVAINDDAGLEREADAMGAQANATPAWAGTIQRVTTPKSPKDKKDEAAPNNAPQNRLVRAMTGKTKLLDTDVDVKKDVKKDDKKK